MQIDDCLSAVDTVVGKHIFDNCIKDFLKDKICLLVTHQEQYLHATNHVILMNMGRIEIQGPYATIKSTHYNSLKRMSSFRTEIEEENQLDDSVETLVINTMTFFRFFLLKTTNYFLFYFIKGFG